MEENNAYMISLNRIFLMIWISMKINFFFPLKNN